MLLLCGAASLLASGLFFLHQVWPDTFPSIETASVETDSVEAASGDTSADASVADSDHPLWQVTATVTERLGSGSQMTSYGLLLHTVNGSAVGNTLHPARAYLLCSYVCDLQPGYTVTLTVRAASLSDVVGTRSASLIGDGYSLGLTSDSEADYLITGEGSGGIRYTLDNLRRQWAARLDRLVGPVGGGLPSALLLGERTYITQDYSRSGAAHLLAISGLHMTILFGILALVLRRLFLPRRVRGVILGVCALGYLCLLDFPPSATRAVIMLGITYLSWLFSANADPVTSLGLAGVLILGLSPCTLADTGFWMSFSATLGLVTVMPAFAEVTQRFTRASAEEKAARRAAQRAARRASQKVPARFRMRACLRRIIWWGMRILTVLITGVVAMTFSLWITARSTGTISPLSPLSTLLLTPLCALVLVLSMLVLPLRGLGITQVLLLPALRTVCGWITGLASTLGEPRWALISLSDPHAETAIGIILTVMTVALLILLGIQLPLRRQWLVCLPAVCGWIFLGLVLGISAHMYSQQVTVTYLQPTTSSEVLVLTRGQEAVICDLSNGSNTALQEAWSQAEAMGATEISALMLTHYHSRTPGALWNLLSYEKVRALWLPEPTDSTDYFLMLSCLEKAELCGVPVYIYRPGDTLTVFGGTEICLETTTLDRSTQPVLLLSIGTANNQLTFCGGAVFESDLSDAAASLCGKSDTVIFGTHGPLIKESYGCAFSERLNLLCFADLETAAWMETSSLPADPPTLVVGQIQVVLDMA
jgi:ComEC/Rec2-related protein